MTQLRFILFTMILCAIIQPALSFGQNNSEIEEFQQSLQKNLDLNDLRKNPILQIDQSDSLLNALNKGNDSLFDAKFYHLLGKMNAERGNFSVAIEYFNTANEFGQTGSRSSFFIHNFLDRGNMYYKNNDVESAENDYNSAVNLAIKLNDKAALATSYNNLGLLELNRKKFSEAKELFTEAYDIRKSLGDDFLIAHSLTYLAMLQFHQEKFESAIIYYFLAKTGFDKIPLSERDERYDNQLTKLHNELGFSFYKLGQNEKAMKYADTALIYSANLSSSYIRAGLMYQSARVVYFAGNCERAMKLAFEINAIASEYTYKDVLQKNYDLISDCYEMDKNYEKAIEYARKSHRTQEEIVNDRLAKKLADERLSFQVLTNRKLLKMAEKESELKSVELKAQQRITQLMGIIILIALLTMGSLLYSNRQKQKVNRKLVDTNKLIEKQNEEIKKQQELIGATNADLKEKFAQLEKMGDEKSHLLSIVAHDLRTPLNSILGLCDLIEMETENEDGGNEVDRKKYIELIKESGNRMLNMTNTLLNVKKIENEEIDVNLEAVDIRETLNKILEEHKSWYNRKSIKINNNVPKSTLALADKFMMQQVLENLVTNAIKYSPLNTSVKISVKEEGKDLIISVQDHGPGISESDQSKLYTEYQRLSAQPTSGEDSMGIGLSLVKKLTGFMNSEVYCESQLGKGSTFNIKIAKAES